VRQSREKSIVGIVPARGGSKGIPRKNLILIDGLSLVERAAQACLNSKNVSHVAVSSDDPEILDSISPGILRIERPESIAQDDSPIEDTFHHARSFFAARGLNPEIFVWLQPNLPVREAGIVDKVVGRLLANPSATAAVTCTEIDPRIYWSKKIDTEGFLEPVFENAELFRRQDLHQPLLIDGAVCAFRVENLHQGKSRVHAYLGDRISPFIQKTRVHSLELDELNDLRAYYGWLNEPKISDQELLEFFGLG
jgi:CMP-N-acetylneuraminic acid synthetase